MKNEKIKKDINSSLIDKVTVTNLDLALRMCDIHLAKSIINKIIDLVELIENKGDNASMKDICELQSIWEKR